MKLEFVREILEKNIRMLNFIKIRSVGTELFNADNQMNERTDEHEANSRLSILCGVVYKRKVVPLLLHEDV
jgi:hypothetical protein